MKIIPAFSSGIRRVNGAPLVLAGVYVLTWLIALPLGLALQQMIADSLGASGAAAEAARGVNYLWWQQFSEQAVGVGRAFSPAIIGGAAVLDNLGSMFDNRAHVLPVAAAGAAYVLVWIFLAGGILDRYARNRSTRAFGFFAACGGYFFRLLRLGIFAGAVYFVLFGFLHPWLFGAVYQAQVGDLTVEWKAFLLRAALYLLFGLVLCVCNLVFDYAKVRMVVEDRRSAVGALLAAVRFVRHRPGAFGLYLLDGGCFALVVAVYALLAPGARVPAWWTLVAGQAYLLARLWVKLLFYASEVAFFQGALAHAEYVAAPLPVWPDSPAADAIGPSRGSGS